MSLFVFLPCAQALQTTFNKRKVSFTVFLTATGVAVATSRAQRARTAETITARTILRKQLAVSWCHIERAQEDASQLLDRDHGKAHTFIRHLFQHMHSCKGLQPASAING